MDQTIRIIFLLTSFSIRNLKYLKHNYKLDILFFKIIFSEWSHHLLMLKHRYPILIYILQFYHESIID